MKIRTDFVTNSSSSSFVTIRVNTKDGKSYFGEFNSMNNRMQGEDSFELTKEFFENLTTCEQLVNEMRAWFNGTFADSSIPEEWDYSEGDFDEISKIETSSIETIEISSMIDYEEIGFGMDMEYNFEEKELSTNNTSYGDFDWDEEYDGGEWDEDFEEDEEE